MPPTADPSIPPGLVEVGRYRTEHEAAEHGLVVLAMRLGYWVEPVADGYSLRVHGSAERQVRAQLELFDRESADWPPRLRPLARLRFHWPTPLAWAVTTAVVFALQRRWPGRFEEFGALRADAVFEAGAWWRVATVLFLHADLGHLVGNLGAGFFLFGLVQGGLRPWRGGLTLAAAALLGNLGAALLHPAENYSSLGASTAVFGALGILTGAAVNRVFRQQPGRRSWRALLPPILAGSALLALYGAGGMRTDVVAHAAGFAAGFFLGIVVPAAGSGPRATAHPGAARSMP